MKLGVIACVVIGCGAPATAPVTPVAPKAAPACLADGLGPIRHVETVDASCKRDEGSCREACERGDAASCMLHAYALQQAEGGETDAMFARACKLGLAIGCTNYAAGLGLHRRPGTPEMACARRLFERACEVREPFGCGMVGRVLAAEAKTPELKAAARAHFDRTCSDIGGVICRMYALHLERGDLGAFEPATVKALMVRACETGDDDACGHDTADETFK